jgi:hypothetical protein
VGTYALLTSDRFLHTLTATPTPSQDGLDDLQLQIFIELQENLQEQ